MGKQKNEQEIRQLLAKVKADLLKGLTVEDSCRKHQLSMATYYRWREKQQGDLPADGPSRRELATELEQYKELVAELTLENRMLKEVTKKKW